MYHHLNTLTIFPEKLTHNLQILSQMRPGVQVVPVVKSNAYGHGIKILAPILAQYDTPFVCVDSLYEAYELEKYGYKKDILIMGYVDPLDVPRRKNFIYAVSDLEYAKALIRKYSRARLHLFFDTGMHREGIVSLDSAYASDILLRIKPNIEGIMSHLSTPDDITVTNKQLQSFQTFQAQLGAASIAPKYVHICASGGLIHADKYDFPIGNLARTGLAYFGYDHPALTPALRCTTKLIQIKTIKKGETVGYDGTYAAKQTMKVGVLPIGYHDGIGRLLSNVGVVLLHGEACPIIGRVSMNLTTIDVSHVDATIGDDVVVIDENPDSPASLFQQGQKTGIILYDMLVHMNKEMFRKKDR